LRTHLDVDRVLELNRRFHDEVESHSYDQRMGVRHDASDVRRTLDELERVLGRALPAGGTVLDLGAGTGNLAVKLALDGRFKRVIAVDISAGMLAEASRAATEHGVALETCVSSMAPLPFADGSVDLVVGCAMLHHVPDVSALMSEVARVLKPGAACVFIGEPSTWGARLTASVKAPVIAAARVVGLLRRRSVPRWDHDDIDVHTFSTDDVRTLTVREFDDLRLVPEGLLEPVLEQALFAPLLLVAGRHHGVARGVRLLRRALEAGDRWLSTRIHPALFVSMKFSAVRA